MVSTRSGSLSAKRSSSDDNNNSNSKRSSSEDNHNHNNKPPSPKRLKGENGGVTEKQMPTTENSNESSPTEEDPDDHGPGDAPTNGCGGGGALISGKGQETVTPAVAVVTPIAEGSTPVVLEKPRSSFSTWSLYHKQNSGFETPWCKLLSQSAQNQNIKICKSSYLIGSTKQCDSLDHAMGTIQCKIKHTQDVLANAVCMFVIWRRDGGAVAVLETSGSKGTVQVNGTAVKRICVLNSGDEVALMCQQLLTEVAVKSAEVHSSMGKLLQLERRSGDPSAVAGASILASLSSLRPIYHAGSLQDRLPVKYTMVLMCPLSLSFMMVRRSSLMAWKAIQLQIWGVIKLLKLEQSTIIFLMISARTLAQRQAIKERVDKDTQLASTSGMSLRCAAFKEDLHAGILDGKNIEVSFDNFPYYLRDVAASCQREMIAWYLAVLCAFRLSILPMLECDSDLSHGRTERVKKPIPLLLDGLETQGLTRCLELREAKYNVKQGCYSFLSGDPIFELDKPDEIKKHAKYTSELTTINPRIVLSGPAGSEIYQEMLAKALAHYFGAKLLVFDSHSFLGGLSSKEAKLMKDGFNAEKSCTCSKQSPVNTDASKSGDFISQ
ncbi:LOW QUALITY PROTEIN: hypothetical protein NC652_035234 [Populus alba x Populus x berolinensis]|nr:LOW QUALITY PROTEIN: hypothetical protein NC652_035234 [Populus alba x Populus x berolinensis]